MNTVAMLASIESLNEITTREIEETYRRLSKLYLCVFRSCVADHATHKHTIKIVAKNGCCFLTVNEEPIMDRYGYVYRGLAIIELLDAIENALDWSWCAYLNGERLN